MGMRAQLCSKSLRTGSGRLPGQDILQPEALPPQHHADIRSTGDSLSIHVDTYGTSKYTEPEIVDIIMKNFDLRPGCIIRDLGLNKPIFKATAAYGHFGREEFPWEKCKELKL